MDFDNIEGKAETALTGVLDPRSALVRTVSWAEVVALLVIAFLSITASLITTAVCAIGAVVLFWHLIKSRPPVAVVP